MAMLPPPPKVSFPTTPNSSHAASSFATPTTSSYSRGGVVVPPSSSSKQQQPHQVSYEAYAPRTAEQRSRLARIAALTAGPCPLNDVERKVSGGSSSGITPTPSTAANTTTKGMFTLADAMCPTESSSTNDNYKNFDILYDDNSIDPAVQQTLDHVRSRTTELTNLIRRSSTLRLALRASINITDDVSRRHTELLLHSGELSAAAERLQHEETLLARRAEDIGRPLRHYDAVDSLGPIMGVHYRDGGRTVVRSPPRLHVDDTEEYGRILEQIDEAVNFFGVTTTTDGGGRAKGSNIPAVGEQRTLEATSSGSIEYYRRACALQDAALELLRVGIADRITQTSTQVADALQLPRVPMASDKLEASLVYTRFHGISRRSNSLISIARRRLDILGAGGSSSNAGGNTLASTGYEDLLALCRNAYCTARETLLGSTVRHHMDTLRERHGLVGMTRLASVFLIRLCTVETALYLDFFGNPDKRRHPRTKTKGAVVDDNEGKDATEEEKEQSSGSAEDATEQGGPNSQQFRRSSSTSTSHPAAAALASQILSEDSTYRDAEFQTMLGSLCSALHRTIRRGLVSVLDLDVLCQVVSVLRDERSAANSSPTTLAAARAVSGVIQDAQERLIFCANDSLHKEVARFKPTNADLNYPGKLLGEKPKVSIVIDDDDNAKMKEANAGEDKTNTDTATTAAVDDAVSAQLRVYESWFPPMRSVLRILSKIFRVVEPRVFEDIALQSVQSCTKSLKDGSVHILKNSGQIHADLFLVKHLLILREQLSPFDIQLRSVERQLDFSEAGKAVTRFLANRNRRLFSMSTENALVTLLREGVSVQESSVDSKRDLEDCLRSACNDFIEHTASSLLGPVAIFIEQCKNATVGSTTSALAKAPFMDSILVKGVFSRALEGLHGELDNVTTQMTLYLENTATQGILLKPSIRKFTRSLEEAKRFIGEVPDGENRWDTDIRNEVLTLVDELESRVKSASSKK